MGYALFASRKIFYCSMISKLTAQLDDISQKRMSLLTLSANISDGKITVEEIASDPANLNNYIGFIQGSDAFKQSEQGGGAAQSVISGFLTDKQYSEQDAIAIANLLDTSLGEEYAKVQSKKLTAAENQLEMQQKRLETKLQIAQQQLKQIETAEQQAIPNSIPKYSGQG